MSTLEDPVNRYNNDWWDWLHADVAKRIYFPDPYDGMRVYSTQTREDMFKWCEEYCKNKYWIGMGFVQFESKEDEAHFFLTWS